MEVLRRDNGGISVRRRLRRLLAQGQGLQGGSRSARAGFARGATGPKTAAAGVGSGAVRQRRRAAGPGEQPIPTVAAEVTRL